MRVLALDPGQRVGWAIGETIVRGQEPAELRVVDHGIQPWRVAAVQVHRLVVIEDRIDVVVMENWVLTARGAKVLVGDDMQSSQFIGAVRLCQSLQPRVQLVTQMPAAMATGRKAIRAEWGADIRERLAKLPKSHDESHDGSALLHLAAFFHTRYA